MADTVHDKYLFPLYNKRFVLSTFRFLYLNEDKHVRNRYAICLIAYLLFACVVFRFLFAKIKRVV